MNADLGQVMGVGVAAVLFAATVLVLLVRGDLAPRLAGGGRWFLGFALGLGIIAFAIKLAVMAALSTFPAMIPEPERRIARPWEPPAAPAHDIAVARPKWQALPAIAPVPAGNPTNPAKVALGERLFHDPALSSDGTVACASCHDVRRGAGADGRPTAVGITGIPGRRNTPTVWNAAFQARLFWDGRAATLEQQAEGPLLNPDEMGMPSLSAVADRVRANPTYRDAFDLAFGPESDIAATTITAAIAAYERTLVTPDSPYDRFVRGDVTALRPEQQRGMWLFQTIGCQRCHSGPNFSGASLIGPRAPFSPLLAGGSEADTSHALSADKGRAQPEAKDGIWRIPSLRNVALTAPYFHNGSVADLGDAVRIMAELQVKAVIGDGPAGRIWWAPDSNTFSAVERRRLDARDIDDIVAFLHALSSDRLVSRADLPHP